MVAISVGDVYPGALSKTVVSMTAPEIPFNRSSLLGRELEYIFQTMTIGQIAGRSDLFQKMPRAARTNAGRSESSGDNFLHARVGDVCPAAKAEEPYFRGIITRD